MKSTSSRPSPVRQQGGSILIENSTTAVGVGSSRAWLLACRPATLTAALAPVAVGTAVSAHQASINAPVALACCLGAGLLQIASNLANDVFDFEKGADTHERLGPLRAVQAGLLSPTQMKRGLAIVITLSIVIGLYLTSVAGPIVIAIGIASIISAIAYTGGPYPLGYHGLGDLFVFIFFGLVAVCGTVFVQTNHVPPLAWLASVPMGALITNILVVNNLRDRHTDVGAGKKTLAVRFGRKGAELQYTSLLGVSYATPLVIFALGWANQWVLLPLITMPIAHKNRRALKSTEGRALNRELVNSAKLVFLFGMTFALGLFASTL